MSVNALIFTEVMNASTISRGMGAYRIATEIRKAGYTCQVIEYFTSFNEIEMDKIMSSFIGEDTLIVGFSSTFFEYIDENLNVYQQMKTGRLTQKPGYMLETLNYPFHQDRIQKWFIQMKKYNPKL